jgi:chromosome segregation ATPase
MEDQFIEEVPERTVIIERTNKTNLEAFDEDSPKIKDAFHNASQYVKLIKNHVQEKKSEFEKFKQDTVKFDKDVSTLRPRQPEINFDLGKLDYKEVKVRQLKQELNILEEERELIRNNITHFNNQINQAQSELSFKVEQIDEIQLELTRLEKKEALLAPIKTEQEAIEVIKEELATIGNVEESKRIFRTVNTLVDLVKSKNKLTVKELNTVKAEFRELQNKYVELMSKLK